MLVCSVYSYVNPTRWSIILYYIILYYIILYYIILYYIILYYIILYYIIIDTFAGITAARRMLKEGEYTESHETVDLYMYTKQWTQMTISQCVCTAAGDRSRWKDIVSQAMVVNDQT